MKRAVAATVSFYVGVIFVILGFIHKIWGFRAIPVAARTFIDFATMWFVVSILLLVHEIFKEIKTRKEEPKE